MLISTLFECYILIHNVNVNILTIIKCPFFFFFFLQSFRFQNNISLSSLFLFVSSFKGTFEMWLLPAAWGLVSRLFYCGKSKAISRRFKQIKPWFSHAFWRNKPPLGVAVFTGIHYTEACSLHTHARLISSLHCIYFTPDFFIVSTLTPI